jgi:FkbM family methyltransferase
MKKLIKKIFFGKKAFQPFWRRLFDIATEGLNIGTGGGDFHKNGESFTLAYILSKEPFPVVFDVGAQGGDHIKEVWKITDGKAKIFAFEPCLKDHQILEKTFRDKANIVKSALGDTEGETILYRPNNVRGLSTVHKPHGKFCESEKVKVETIDAFCKQNGVTHITFLKLDVEGHELPCLKGAKQMLPNIKYIQFEFSGGSRDSRTYFRDIFDFLSDYKIYRILKDGFLEIKNPEKITELLFTTNYLAIRNV